MVLMNWWTQIEASAEQHLALSESTSAVMKAGKFIETLGIVPTASFLLVSASILTRLPTGSSKGHRPCTPMLRAKVSVYVQARPSARFRSLVRHFYRRIQRRPLDCCPGNAGFGAARRGSRHSRAPMWPFCTWDGQLLMIRHFVTNHECPYGLLGERHLASVMMPEERKVAIC